MNDVPFGVLMSETNSCNLKVSQLQAFVAVADRGNFSLAAFELGLSQSTVSHAIATLEAELGIMLLTRGRHGAKLTSEGEEVLPEARQILQHLASIQRKARSAKGLQSGQVRVGTVRSIATHVLPEVIAQFRQKFPNVSVVILEFDRYAEVEQSLRENQVELGFTSLPTTPEFETWKLFRDEFVALLPPGTIDPDASLTWEQLINSPMIVNHRSLQHNKIVSDHLLQFGHIAKIGYEVREDSTIISMVKQGLGAAIMARLAAEPIPAEIQVQRLPVPLERVLGVAIVTDCLLSRAGFAFLDVLKAVCQSDDGVVMVDR